MVAAIKPRAGLDFRRAFDRPDVPAHPGWEPLSDARRRLVAAASEILDRHPGEDVVMVGHGTAWTLLDAALRHQEPDLDRWARLAMPDVICCDVGARGD